MKDLQCQQNLGSKHILVVDDIIDNSLLLATLLEAEGYKVDTTDCGYKAIAKIEVNPPDLVLLDVMMPDIDGYEVARWIAQNQPSVAIVLVSAYDSIPQLDQQQVRIDGFIRKPYDIEQLLQQVETVLERKQSPGDCVENSESASVYAPPQLKSQLFQAGGLEKQMVSPSEKPKFKIQNSGFRR